MHKKTQRKGPVEINLVPYIDVMLVLLIIFMVTAPLLQQGVNVDLPKAQAQALPPQAMEPIIVSIDKQGQVFLNIAAQPNQPIESKALWLSIRAATEHYPERKILVKADQQVPYAKVMDAMVLLQRAGAKGIGLITQGEGELS